MSVFTGPSAEFRPGRWSRIPVTHRCRRGRVWVKSLRVWVWPAVILDCSKSNVPQWVEIP